MNMQQELSEDDCPLDSADLLEEMVMALVDHPAAVRVNATSRGRTTDYVVHTDPRDFGKVIGKSGRTVESIRIFLNVVASKDGRQATVSMAEEARGRQKDRVRYLGHPTVVERRARG